MYNQKIMENMADIHSFLYSQGQKVEEDLAEKELQEHLDKIDDENERAFDNYQQEK